MMPLSAIIRFKLIKAQELMGLSGLKGLNLSTYLPVSEYFFAFDSFSPRIADLPMDCTDSLAMIWCKAPGKRCCG
jgi:hypothetical protein